MAVPCTVLAEHTVTHKLLYRSHPFNLLESDRARPTPLNGHHGEGKIGHFGPSSFCGLHWHDGTLTISYDSQTIVNDAVLMTALRLMADLTRASFDLRVMMCGAPLGTSAPVPVPYTGSNAALTGRS